MTSKSAPVILQAMRIKPVWIIACIAAWLLWCVLVIQTIVPAVQRHFTMYAQLIAIVFCLLPVLVVATAAYLRKAPTDSE